MEGYTYAPLNLDEPAFRLIRLFAGSKLPLQCELVHALLTPGDAMDYEAVSYTWVQQMATIYGQAERVLVWLGTSTHEMDLAMCALIELQAFYKDLKWIPQDNQAVGAWKSLQKKTFQDRNGPIYRGIKRIFDQPWFRRVWILQEVRNARRASIYCGKHSVSSTLFCSAPFLFGIDVDPHCQAVLDLMPGSPARPDKQSPCRDFLTLLRQFRNAKATVEHDHIYALLGLSPKQRILDVSYEMPISEVISELYSSKSISN
ncbi:heterokaryon incompatibility protein-domain-containing protein [Xylaria arbuscula]|nr:heterokaryon incompatibility protein-domain-containing protein [Xylaria arbuscula]